MDPIDFHGLFSDIPGVSKKSLSRGEVLFRQGEPADFVFSVEAGELRLLRYTSDGHSVCLHTAHDGECFAEAALFTDTYHCNGEAAKDTKVWCYPRAAVLKRVEEDPRCMRQLYSLLAGQVRYLRLMLELRSVLSATERILQLFHLRAGTNRIVRLTGTLIDLARELGMAHETLYRSLAEIEKSGAVRRLDSRTFELPPC